MVTLLTAREKDKQANGGASRLKIYKILPLFLEINGYLIG